MPKELEKDVPSAEDTPARAVEVIAEVGSNYNGDLEEAVRYVRAARAAGADAVKFQTIRKERLVAPRVRTEDGWWENPVFKGFSNLELPDEWHFRLKEEAEDEGIEFLSTPFYVEAVDLLERVGVRRYKIASGDITFRPLLEAVGNTGKPVILSTGASSLDEVGVAIDTLDMAGAGPVTLLHCVANYPPRWDEMNLRAIATLLERFRRTVGISDHSPGSLVPVAAVALGARTIEKHVTFDRSAVGPDHPFAMTVEEFASMVEDVRQLDEALGTGRKEPMPSEREKKRRIRRGVYDPETFEPRGDGVGIWLRPEHHEDG